MRRILYVLIILVLSSFRLFPANLSGNDSVVLNAMRDELQRSMDELVIETFDPPFYIAYTIADVDEIFVSATLGALAGSDSRRNRTWFARVMVGDYEINDENYQDYNNIESNEVNLPLPIEYDYYGIRRSLWTVTNRIYKMAALGYKNKMAALRQNKLSDSSLQIPDFARAEVIKVYEPDIAFNVDVKQLESLARQVSSTFRDYPDIVNSNVNIDVYKGRVYFVSSEGAETVFSKVVLSLQANADVTNDDGDIFSDHVSYYALLPDDLPSVDEVVADIRLMVANLYSLKKAPALDENYFGPILFLDQTVAGILEENLFDGPEKLVAIREPLINSPQMKMYYGDAFGSMESKIDRRIASSFLTVKAYPRMNEHNGVRLIGGYNYDAEGVKPPDELVLIENGILRTLLNGRTPTRKIPLSNGHSRHSITYSGMTKEIGPGVISVTSSNSMGQGELKQKLIEMAKHEGLDYGIMLKPLKKSGSHQPVNMYRVWTNDGREELISSAYINSLPDNALRSVAATSDGQVVYNSFLGNGYGLNTTRSMSRGIMVSYIVPDGILFEEAEVMFRRKPVVTAKPVVRSPLFLLNQPFEMHD